MKQAIDGATHQTIAKVVKRAFILLKICGAQTISDYHIITFKHFIHHGWCRISGVGVVPICHNIHISINIFEYGTNYVTFALTWFPLDDCAFGRSDFSSIVSGIVVIYIDISIR